MDIRFVFPSEVKQLARSVMTSSPSKTPTALPRNMGGELHHPGEGYYLDCFDGDGTLLGSILTMDFTLNARGVMMPMGTAAYASANLLHEKERVVCTFLKVLMWYYAEQGTPIDCPHPFNPVSYVSMGYGYCDENYPYQPRPSATCSYGDESGLSYVRSEDRQEILDFYCAYAACTHGATVHHYMDPHRISDIPYAVACRRDGRLIGYFIFDFVAVGHYTDIYHDLLMSEMVYEDLDILRQFMTSFASQVDQIKRVRILSPDLSLTMPSHNLDTGENRTHDGCIHEIVRRTMGYMTRIFDVSAYFRVQSRCESPVSRPFVLALQVDDSFIEDNNGTFLLNISGSTVEVVKHAQPDATLFADIPTLFSLVMNAFSLNETLRLGRLTLSGHGYAADV